MDAIKRYFKMGRIFGVEFAPILSTSLERRIQTLCIIFGLFLLAVMPVMLSILLFMIAYWGYWSLFIGYVIWWIWDVYYVKVQQKGGRRSKWLRSSGVAKNVQRYFPASLVKTAELDPSKNYLLGVHPHGIMGVGAICAFGTDACGFLDLFPGITPYLLTLKMNFFFPIARAYFLYLGLCDVSKESISHILTKSGTGNACAIVVGGAEEALEAHAGVYKICLKHRKGFVKQALLSGASLVPCFIFGENELFKQAPNPAGSTLRKIQTLAKRWTGVSPPLFHGRGVFQYTFGVLPFRRPLHTVVGEPIDVPKTESPTIEQLNEYHQIYMEKLVELFENNKLKYGLTEDKHIEFV